MNSSFLTILNGKRNSTPYYQLVRRLLGSSLIQYHTYNETSGLIANDASGNGRHSNLVGSPIFSAEGIGDGKKCINFNAVGEVDGYSASLAAAFNGSRGTFGVWARPNLASCWTDTNTYSFCFIGNTALVYHQLRKNGGDPKVISYINRVAGVLPIANFMNPSTARWIHLVMRWDKDNDKIELFINGTRGREVNALPTWTGTLAATYVRYADTSTAIANQTWPGRLAHQFLTNSVVSNDTIYTLSKSIGQVIVAGDSRSFFKPWTSSAVESAYPNGDFCFGRMGHAAYAGSGWAISPHLIADASNVDALICPGKNILIVWAGVNDVGGTTAETIYNRLASYCTARRAAGWKVLVCTEIDAQTVDLNAAGYHSTIWPALNTLIRNNYSFADRLIDLGANPNLQDATNTTYYNTDALHLVDAGYAEVAAVAAPILSTI